MPARTTASGSYRYGFNGKENDDEVKGNGNQQDYGFRIYDPRLGRFLSVDPLTKKFPFYSPYHYAGNSPIKNIDLDGAEPAGNPWDWDVLQSGRSYTVAQKANNGSTVVKQAEQQLVRDKAGFKAWITHYSWTEREATYGIAQKANAYSWFNADKAINLPANDAGRWQSFNTELIQSQKTMQDLVNKTGNAVFQAAFTGASLFAGGGAHWALKGFSKLTTEAAGQFMSVGGDLSQMNATALVTAPFFGGGWKQLATKNIINSFFEIKVTGEYSGIELNAESAMNRTMSAAIGFGYDKGLEALQNLAPTFSMKNYSRFRNLNYKSKYATTFANYNIEYGRNLNISNVANSAAAGATATAGANLTSSTLSNEKK